MDIELRRNRHDLILPRLEGSQHEAAIGDTGPEGDDEVSLDAERLLSAALGRTSVLTRIEEGELTGEIVAARERVRAILRAAPALCGAALADGGRGVVLPEQDFRETEAVTVLDFARRALSDREAARAAGLPRRALRAFAADLSAALEDYRVLRDRMVRANVRLVSVLARRYRHPNLSYLDLFQEGTIGLLRAIEKYDPAQNVRFSTYATWWIWQRLGRSGDALGSLIRTPVHWNQLRRRLDRQAHGTAAAEVDGAVSGDRVAATEGMDPARLETMSQGFRFVSFDAPVSEDDERGLESLLPADGGGPEEEFRKIDLREHLRIALDELPAREAAILRQRFGLDCDRSETLDQIGSQLGVSRERVRQLEARALRRLREICGALELQEYLN